MKVQLGCGALLAVVTAFCFAFFGYVANIVSLCKCDFEAPVKAEVIRSVGVIIPVVGVVTGYIDIEDGKKDEASLSD